MKKTFSLFFFTFYPLISCEPHTIGPIIGAALVITCFATEPCWQCLICKCAEKCWDPCTQSIDNQCAREDLNCTCLCKTCAQKTKMLFTKKEPIIRQPTISDANAHLREYVSVHVQSPRSDGNQSDDTLIIYGSDSENNLSLH